MASSNTPDVPVVVSDQDIEPRDKRSWTTDEQWAWLSPRRPAFRASQRAGERASFLAGLYVDWLTKEEDEALGIAIAKRREQLESWFKNKERARGTSKTLAMLLASAGITKKSKRLPQAREVFSKQNYKEVVQPIVSEKLTQIEHDTGRRANRKETMTIVQSTIAEEYEAASQEVKDAIAVHIAQEKQKAVAAREALALERDKPRTPQDYQAALDIAPKLVEAVFDPLSRNMGWTYSLFGAGPVPEDNGSMSSMAAHFGRNEHGHTLAQATPNFQEQFILPFGRFAQAVFPRDVRDQRSIQAQASQVGQGTSSATMALPAESSPPPHTGAPSDPAATPPPKRKRAPKSKKKRASRKKTQTAVDAPAAEPAAASGSSSTSAAGPAPAPSTSASPAPGGYTQADLLTDPTLYSFTDSTPPPAGFGHASSAAMGPEFTMDSAFAAAEDEFGLDLTLFQPDIPDLNNPTIPLIFPSAYALAAFPYPAHAALTPASEPPPQPAPLAVTPSAADCMRVPAPESAPEPPPTPTPVPQPESAPRSEPAPIPQPAPMPMRASAPPRESVPAITPLEDSEPAPVPAPAPWAAPESTFAPASGPVPAPARASTPIEKSQNATLGHSAPPPSSPLPPRLSRLRNNTAPGHPAVQAITAAATEAAPTAPVQTQDVPAARTTRTGRSVRSTRPADADWNGGPKHGASTAKKGKGGPPNKKQKK
ncbi:hypothetical protein OH76DRAFT_1490034 [Lentinus brumalis]|uniref:Uncharacterized protein n=1 Tax=Lentinus brumalis TaxID=2498619 RepID=A0A371CKF0_9APHY|nr:hypothetical protein OH76DRAFT_1490034 [Polyporus brumalis]